MRTRRPLHFVPALLGLLLAAAPVSAAEPAPAASASLDWLAGSWAGEKEGTVSEEHWTTGAGGTHVGLHKDVRAGRMTSFEFLRIQSDADGKICYIASPRGAAPTTFCAIETGDRRVVFENRGHDFPQRILYWLDESGRLHARIEGPMNGAEVAEEWVWSRVER